MKRIRMSGFDEYDGLGRSRRLYTSFKRAGVADAIKRRYRRRERRTARDDMRKGEQ